MDTSRKEAFQKIFQTPAADSQLSSCSSHLSPGADSIVRGGWIISSSLTLMERPQECHLDERRAKEAGWEMKMRVTLRNL